MVWMTSMLFKELEIKPLKQFLYCLYTMLLLGFLSWPFFLMYGYGPILIGSAHIPVAAVLSGLVMITWYWFTWLYYRYRRVRPFDRFFVLFDAALLALVVCSLGAWGVSVFQFSGIDNALFSSALTHFFLAVFTEGWTVLATFTLLWSHSKLKNIPVKTGWFWIPILFGSMLIFPFSLSQSMVTPVMILTAKSGMLMIILCTALNLFFLIKSGRFSGLIWKTVIFLFVLKILLQSLVILPTDIWPGTHGVRVFYLHLLLLGVVSVTFLKTFQPDDKRAVYIFTGSVLLVLVSLAMISGYWPIQWVPKNILKWVMILALFPVLSTTWILGFNIKKINHIKA